MKKLKVIASISICLFIIIILNTVVIAETEEYVPFNNQMIRTKEEIINKYNELNVSQFSSNIFAQEPDIKGPNYKEGILSEDIVSDVVDMINLYRYMAGTEAISIREKNMSYAAKGALLLGVSDFNMKPNKPEDMSDEFYEDALKGTYDVTLTSEYYNDDIIGVDYSLASDLAINDLVKTSIDGLKYTKKIDNRLMLLNSSTKQVAFGYTDKTGVKYANGVIIMSASKYLTLNSFYTSVNSINNYYTWPAAGYCPVELVNPNSYWSISFDTLYRFNSEIDPNDYIKRLDPNKEIITLKYNDEEYKINEIFVTDTTNDKAIYFDIPSELRNKIKDENGKIKPRTRIYVSVNGSQITLIGNEVNLEYYIDFIKAEKSPIVEIKCEDKVTLHKGQRYKLDVEVLPEDTTDDKTLIYESLNEDIATVDNDGIVYAQDKIGETIVNITASNGVKKSVVVEVNNPSVKYQIQVEGEGWHDVKVDGENAARNIPGHKMQAMKVNIDTSYEGSIEYNLHVENIGWQGYRKDGVIAGVENGNLRTEAIKMRLTGEVAEKYDLYYRLHIENAGWLTWAKNDEPAGSSGRALSVEGMQIVLVPKDQNPPEMDPIPNRNEPFMEKVNVIYQTHIENIGWQNKVRNGVTAGAPGKHLRIEGIKIKTESTTQGSVEYVTHVQNRGWLNKVSADTYSGTTGLGLRTEAVRINLTGDLAENSDIFYRIHVEGVGWLGWAKNGEEAGSTGYGKKLEGIEIKIYKKGDLMAPIQDGNSCMNK